MSLVPVALLLSALATQPYDLQVKAAAGESRDAVLCAELNDFQVGGVSMGVTGSAEAKVTTRVEGCDEEKGLFDLVIALSDVRAVFNDAEQAPPELPPVKCQVDSRGRLVALDMGQAAGALDVMASGGAPLQAIVVAAALARLPDHAVEVGDEWEIRDRQPTPYGVEADVTYKNRLVSVEDGLAVMEGSVRVEVPGFKTANPIQPGTDITIKGGVLEVSGLVQVVELATGLVRESRGRVRLAMDAVIEDWGQEMEVALDVGFGSGQDKDTARARLEEAQRAEVAGGGAGQEQEEEAQQQAEGEAEE